MLLNNSGALCDIASMQKEFVTASLDYAIHFTLTSKKTVSGRAGAGDHPCATEEKVGKPLRTDIRALAACKDARRVWRPAAEYFMLALASMFVSSACKHSSQQSLQHLPNGAPGGECSPMFTCWSKDACPPEARQSFDAMTIPGTCAHPTTI